MKRQRGGAREVRQDLEKKNGGGKQYKIEG